MPSLRREPKPNRLKSARKILLSAPAEMQVGKRQLREGKKKATFSTERFAVSELHVEFQPQVWPCKRLLLRPRGDVTERQALKAVQPC